MLQWHVPICTLTRSYANLICVTGKERVVCTRVNVKRAIPYVWLCVKDGLGAISVMVVYVQDGDPFAVFTQYLCSNSRVVQIAVAAKKVRASVMPRWTA